MSKTKVDHLEVFSKSNTKMASGHPNIKEWKIVDHTGQKVGTVYDMLFDTESNVIRYIITNLKNGELLEQDRLVLMPVGMARINDSQNEVVFPNITKDQIKQLPDFLTIEHFTQEDEYAVRNALRSPGESVVSTENTDRSSFYDHEVFSTDNFYSGSYLSDDTERNETSRRNSGSGLGNSRDVNASSGRAMDKTADRKDNDVNVHPDPEERSTGNSSTGNNKRNNDLNKS